MLGGWASEERLLDRLQKAAEKNLAKDPAAAESKAPHVQSSKGVAAKEEMVVDDSGEQVPEATLRAEAAALGYTGCLFVASFIKFIFELIMIKISTDFYRRECMEKRLFLFFTQGQAYRTSRRQSEIENSSTKGPALGASIDRNRFHQ
jgi:hypothetical protein